MSGFEDLFTIAAFVRHGKNTKRKETKEKKKNKKKRKERKNRKERKIPTMENNEKSPTIVLEIINFPH